MLALDIVTSIKQNNLFPTIYFRMINMGKKDMI